MGHPGAAAHRTGRDLHSPIAVRSLTVPNPTLAYPILLNSHFA